MLAAGHFTKVVEDCGHAFLVRQVPVDRQTFYVEFFGLSVLSFLYCDVPQAVEDFSYARLVSRFLPQP